MSPAAPRAWLLGRLTLLNKELAGLGAVPLVTNAAAALLPNPQLREVVMLTADRVVTVARALDGMP